MTGKRGLEQHLANVGTGVELGRGEAAQPDLLGEGEAKGEAAQLPAPGGEKKAGRPKGAVNRSTAQMVRYLNTFGQGPLVGLAKIVNMVDAFGLPDFAAIAKVTGMERADAARFWRDCARELAPYQHQKLPIAVAVRTETDLDILVVNAGATIDDAPTDLDDLLGGAFGEVIEGEYEDLTPDGESEQNQ